MVAALQADYTSAPIAPDERAMVDFAVKLTRDATQIGPYDHERLRALGFDDAAGYLEKCTNSGDVG